MGYLYVNLAQVSDLPQQLASLSNLAFAEYEGAPEVDSEFIAWYLRRPGSGPECCVGALCGDTLVACVLVAIQELTLGGEKLPCGLIDTVATHPDHRRQGLAHHLMDRAHARIRTAGGEAAVLYTNPENHPYRFYGRLGYLARAQASFLTGSRPEPTELYTVRPIRDTGGALVRNLVNATYGGYEGYACLDDALWEWHRVTRPCGMPVTVVVAESEGQVVGTAALARSEVLLGGARRPLCFVSDAVYPDRECLRALLSAAPELDLAALYDTRAPQAADLQAVGFTGQLGEVSMVLPFTERAGALLSHDPAPWYVMVESVVGV